MSSTLHDEVTNRSLLWGGGGVGATIFGLMIFGGSIFGFLFLLLLLVPMWMYIGKRLIAFQGISQKGIKVAMTVQDTTNKEPMFGPNERVLSFSCDNEHGRLMFRHDVTLETQVMVPTQDVTVVFDPKYEWVAWRLLGKTYLKKIDTLVYWEGRQQNGREQGGADGQDRRRVLRQGKVMSGASGAAGQTMNPAGPTQPGQAVRPGHSIQSGQPLQAKAPIPARDNQSDKPPHQSPGTRERWPVAATPSPEARRQAKATPAQGSESRKDVSRTVVIEPTPGSPARKPRRLREKGKYERSVDYGRGYDDSKYK